MAENLFDLAGLFEQAFGYKTRAFSPEFNAVTGDSNPSRITSGAHGSPYYAHDEAGVEYFLPVILSYEKDGSTIELSLPYPVVSVTSKKTIIETPLTERGGTVKELVNVQDYEIVVKGFIVNNAGNEFPEQQVAALRGIYEQNAALSIQCPLTDIFLLRPGRSGSDKVVVRDMKFPAVTGIKNVRPYELHLVSDEPFNLINIS